MHFKRVGGELVGDDVLLRIGKAHITISKDRARVLLSNVKRFSKFSCNYVTTVKGLTFDVKVLASVLANLLHEGD